ncbi:CinA family protein [Schlesneria paludicola]|uniref:CinA family protein n=1 Tax=Schlesneria paludicola TaxID=360056 RepID=UPI00029B32A1|nr:nicotinamide-nucleotide amidohydrolase family protein [Schlesneria paludicola]
MTQPLNSIAGSVARALAHQKKRIVFAESCTAGLVSATLGRIPGISEYLCGSAVVYRLDTKTQWLGVPESMLLNPGPVSEPVALAMALGVLSRTPEADLAAAVTGHLGPNAPTAQDGLVFLSIVDRNGLRAVQEHRLPHSAGTSQPAAYPGDSEREQRQWHAVDLVLRMVAAQLNVETADH